MKKLFVISQAIILGLFIPRLACAAVGAGDFSITLNLLSNQEIWSGSFRQPENVFDDHSAFTDLVRYQGDLFVAFRESTGHVPGTNGRGTVLRSSDNGGSWTRVADLRKGDFPAYDLRDLKLSITPAGELMAYTAGANYTQGSPADRRDYASFYNPISESFGSLTEMQPTPGSQFQETQSDWLWRMTWNDDVAYGIGYRASDQDSSRDSYLYSSTDGLNWDTVSQVVNPVNHVGETTIRFDEDDNMYLLSRGRFLTSGNPNNLAYLGVASPDTGYTQFTWTPLIDENGIHRQLGGPNMIITPTGEILVASRKPGSEGTSDGGNKTNLAQITLDGTWRDIMELPSGGDTSYAGLVLEDETLYVSYYSQPASGTGDPHIFFSELEIGYTETMPWNGIEGDINQNGVFFGDGTGSAELDDFTAFVEGWGSTDLPGLLGTKESYQHGDLNFDGKTNLSDVYLFRNLTIPNGAGSELLDQLGQTVPEPSSFVLLALALTCISHTRKSQRR